MTLGYRDNAIRLLAAGFADEFAEFCAGDERMHEMMLELASEFLDQNFTIVDEESSNDVAVQLVMEETCRPV